jgi:nucleolar pre-ribosomal-associated protein 1
VSFSCDYTFVIVDSVPIDIRTLYILFILSFLDPATSSAIKSTYLEQRRDVISSVFKGLDHDSYSVVRKVLETLWTGVLSDGAIKRTLKVNLFNEEVISHVCGFGTTSLYSKADHNADPQVI